jgi:hypothetical protein
MGRLVSRVPDNGNLGFTGLIWGIVLVDFAPRLPS